MTCEYQNPEMFAANPICPNSMAEGACRTFRAEQSPPPATDTPPGTYTIMPTATSSKLTHSTKLTLIVQ
jgi:hypothetical protein